MSPIPNPRLLLKDYAPDGTPLSPGKTLALDTSSTLDIDNVPLNGGFLLKSLIASIDPYMRGRMFPPSPTAVAPSFELNQPLVNFGVGEIVRSENPKYKKGDLLYGYITYESFAVRQDGDTYIPWQVLDKASPIPIETYMTFLGMPGHTGYCGWKAFIEPAVKEGETIFVSSGAGAVGSFVIQVAKIKKLKVIACGGSDEKVEFLRSIGADVAFNYKKEDTRDILAKHGPINVYWDNTAGKTLEDAIDFMAQKGVIVSCGAIDYHYNGTAYGVKNTKLIHLKSLKIFGLFYTDHLHHLATFGQDVVPWILEGKMKALEDKIKLEQVEDRFLALQDGLNNGKSIITFT